MPQTCASVPTCQPYAIAHADVNQEVIQTGIMKNTVLLGLILKMDIFVVFVTFFWVILTHFYQREAFVPGDGHNSREDRTH